MTDWSPSNSHQVSYAVVKLTDDNMLSNVFSAPAMHDDHVTDVIT